MKILATLAALSVLFLATVHVAPTEDNDTCNSGICVIEFNAKFNSSNTVPWIEELDDCSTSRVDIVSSPEMQKKHKIVVVPTIVIFNEGEEVKRFQANIMMTMEATKDDVQEAVDEALMGDF